VSGYDTYAMEGDEVAKDRVPIKLIKGARRANR
jgi:hypothetical protein